MNENDIIEYDNRTGEKRHAAAPDACKMPEVTETAEAESIAEELMTEEPTPEGPTLATIEMAKHAAYWEARAVEAMTLCLVMAKRLGLSAGSLDLFDADEEPVEWSGLAINLGSPNGMVMFAVTFDWVDAIMQEVQLESWGRYQLAAIRQHSNAAAIPVLQTMALPANELPSGMIQGNADLIQKAREHLQESIRPMVYVDANDTIETIREKAQISSAYKAEAAYKLITEFLSPPCNTSSQ